MVERGDADIAHDFDADIVAKIKDGPKIKIVSGLSLNQVYSVVNTSAEVGKELADKRVRQAIAYAIDYEGIIKGLIAGRRAAAPTMIPLGILGVDKGMARKRDVAKAKQLLTEAGYPNGFELKLNYWTRPLLGVAPSPWPRSSRPTWPRSGIKVDARAEGALGGRRRVPGGKVQMISPTWTPDYLDPDPWADAFYKKGGPAPSGSSYDNPKMNDLVATAKRETGPQEAGEIYRRSRRSRWRTCRGSC